MTTRVDSENRSASLVALLTLCMLAASSCIVGGDKCDEHQVVVHGTFELCVCEPGAVINPDGVGCTPCGAHEEVKDDACVCKSGFAKTKADGACMKSEIGAACDATTSCGSDFPYCASSAAEGYCTSECADNGDCPTDWTCETQAETHYCSKPRTGLGASCASSADCADFDAKFCDTFQTHTCLLADCATGDTLCPNAWACCDFSSLLGSPLSICTTPEQLTSGDCPMGGTLVEP